MAQVTSDYTILSNVSLNQYDPTLQQAVSGHEIRAKWTRSNTVVRVFVPDDVYNATEVDSRIRQAGYLDEQVANLGGSVKAPPAPPPAA